jgi:hypothetical protein
MFSSEAFIRQFEKETRICINLLGKMPAGGLDYRPTLGQRSTLELLRYMSFGPYNTVRRIVHGDWSLGKPAAEVTKEWPASDIAAKFTWQAQEVARLVRSANPVDLETKPFTFPWGETLMRGEALVVHPLNWLSSYRMQFFLYLKAAGAKEIGTPELWR